MKGAVFGNSGGAGLSTGTSEIDRLWVSGGIVYLEWHCLGCLKPLKYSAKCPMKMKIINLCTRYIYQDELGNVTKTNLTQVSWEDKVTEVRPSCSTHPSHCKTALTSQSCLVFSLVSVLTFISRKVTYIYIERDARQTKEKLNFSGPVQWHRRPLETLHKTKLELYGSGRFIFQSIFFRNRRRGCKGIYQIQVCQESFRILVTKIDVQCLPKYQKQ